MRIAFIVSGFPNLSQTFVLNQITGLLDRGHEVGIFASMPGDPPSIHADVEKYHLLNRTRYYGPIYQIMPKNKLWRLLKAMWLLATSLHKMPKPLLKALDWRRFGTEARSLGTFYRTIAFLEQGIQDYDIVHCHFGPNGSLGALLKEVGATRGKLITVFHGFDLTQYVRNEGPHGYESLFEIGDLFLPISERWREELMRLGCDPQKIVVHRMGVDTGKFLSAPHQPAANGQVQLLTIARLVEKKGVEYGIQAVASVLKRYPHLSYRIAGDGPLRSDLQRLIDRLDTGEKVKLLGWKPHDEIVNLFREADILLAPSVTAADGDQEGIPVVLMEALAQGLPVLSTYHSGIPELVQDGESGFLVPERDVDALAERLEYLVRHPELWPEMGKAGRGYVERHYDINTLNDQLVRLYQRLLDGEPHNGKAEQGESEGSS